MQKDKPANLSVTRRKFMKIIGATSAGLMANPSLLSGLYAAPADYTAKVATATVASYDEAILKEAVEMALANIGGLSDIIKPGDKVGIKINLTGGSSHAESYQNSSGLHPGDSYWTNPTLLKVVGQAIKDAGAGQIYILEAIYDWESVNNFGYKEVIDYLGATFIDLNQVDPYNDYIQKSVGDENFIYSELTLNGIFNDIDCFISMPKAKQHESAGITHGMKNLVGILPVPSGEYNDGKGHRAAIHNHRRYDNNKYNNLCRVIMDINRATPIQLVVNDAVKTVLGSEGPWTSTGIIPATFDKIIIGKDPVAVDSVSTDVIGLDAMADDYRTPFKKNINYLRLATEQGLGEYDLSKIEVVDNASAIDPEAEAIVPGTVELHQNYPNPFNPATTIKFSVKNSTHVSLKIFNARGQEVDELFNGRISAGTHELNWNAGKFASGVYMCQLRANNIVKNRRLVYTK